jgi:hypothetical protein
LVRELGARGWPFLVWYPVFWINNPQRLVDATGLPGCELLWGEFTGRPGHASKGAGLLAGGAAAPILADAAPLLAALARHLGGRLSWRTCTDPAVAGNLARHHEEIPTCVP